MNWQELFRALALVLVIEGLLPFLSPQAWKDAMTRALQVSSRALRVMGLLGMLAGLLLLQLIGQGPN
ncbi:MAG TPA: DUF2065 domain-containing protein [Gammaproteobacteria bacterium]|nr:DUF2065 domain-containing protein [Gammaproteobacteria bacterium]